MSEPKPRRWFQIHLSTAVVMMVVAGFLLWANMRAAMRFGPSYGMEPLTLIHYEFEYGWPLKAFTGFKSENGALVGNDIVLELKSPTEPTFGSFASTAWSSAGVACDGIVFLFTLFLTAFLVEYLIRRREARKP